jgi:hypothetical protein
MQNKVLKISLASVITMLLIGMSLIPSISGQTQEMNLKSNNDSPVMSLMGRSYVNAHWKFDTGSGTTAFDSSGHDYDGTIHGATWTTDTPSGSGYALDFDGNNDYVDLDTHSTNLGFNKTDDLIFSVYIKTTTNKHGRIYSTSTGWGTNPEFHIFMADNGTIGVMAEVTSCGFTIYTNDSYNNGAWYYLEVWFNGISNKPTVEIFVDHNPVASITHWVCPFDNTEFSKTKLGRRSHNSTSYFDGKIDDMKIIKYAGGNEQEPPEIDGPISGDPGVEYDFTFTTYDPEEDDIWIWIDWDDGDEDKWLGSYESGEEVTVSHKYDEEGQYNITAQSKDVWHHSRWSDEYIVLIGNQAPSPPEISGRRYGDAGEEITYTFVSNDNELNDIRYFIEWDDGETEWTGYYSSGEEVEVSHSWDSNGDYEITAIAEDDHNKQSTLSDPYLIRIGDQPPNRPDINGPKNGVPGVEYDFYFEVIDPEGDDVYFEIEWGDGTGIPEYGPVKSGEEIKLSHTYSRKGTFTIRARATDSFGNTGDWYNFDITIPRNKAFNLNILELLLNRLSNTFPILKLFFSL